jgi:3-vinyl bacteriochlorophyllide hydratase
MMLTPRFFDHFIESVDCCPWGTSAGRIPEHTASSRPIQRRQPLYTAEERRRRDETQWTLVQGVLAPVQFVAFFISLCLVVRYLATGDGLVAATNSVVIKTSLLYAIMITGSIWEKQVFGRYLFAPAFFWEDVFSIVVLVMHTAYLAGLFTGYLDSEHLMLLALAAYASYVVNATQFLLKLRAARLDHGKSLRLATLPGSSH